MPDYRVNLDEIKAQADFRTVLTHYGIEFRGSGPQIRIKCPFHDDKNPSCSVNLSDKVFNCKAGSCGAKGNIVQFVQRKEGDINPPAAGERLAEICGITLSDRPKEGSGKPQERQNGSSMGNTTGAKERAVAGSEEPIEGKNENKPLEAEFLARYVPSLDITHPYLLERIGGDAMEAWGPCGYSKAGIMKGRACLSVRNVDGQVVAFLGRWTGDLGELPEDEDKYKFPKGYSKTLDLFGLWKIDRQARWLTVVEGAYGAIRLDRLGYPAAALLGSSMSERQVALLKEHCPGLRLIVLLFDGDEAGRIAVDKVAVMVARHWATRIVELSDGEEPDTVDEAVLEELVQRRPSR